MAPAVTAIVTTCKFDRRNSPTAMLRRVRRDPITPWTYVSGNPNDHTNLSIATRAVFLQSAWLALRAQPGNPTWAAQSLDPTCEAQATLKSRDLGLRATGAGDQGDQGANINST